MQKSRGDTRKKYLEAFLVHSLRNRSTTKLSTQEKKVVHGEQNFTDSNWWAKEKMDLELGGHKAEALRASKKLDTRPCRITGERPNS